MKLKNLFRPASLIHHQPAQVIQRWKASRGLEVGRFFWKRHNVHPHCVFIARNLDSADGIVARPIVIDEVPECFRERVQVVSDRDLAHFVFPPAPRLVIVHVAAQDGRHRRIAEKPTQAHEARAQTLRRVRMLHVFSIGPSEKLRRCITERFELEFQLVSTAAHHKFPCLGFQPGSRGLVAFGGDQVGACRVFAAVQPEAVVPHPAADS